MRLRRSLLWAAGNRWERILEAVNSKADCVVFDLEDSVPMSEKDNARAMVLKALTLLDFKGKEKIVRINPINSELGQKDISVIAEGRPDSIRLPKCDTVDYVLQLDAYLAGYEKKHSLDKDTIKIILMIESALGVRNAFELASCSSRITAMGLGAEDLTADLKTSRTTSQGLQIELLYARQKLVIDGTAAKVDVLDSSSLAFNDNDDVRAETQMIKQMGFVGKSAATLTQVEIINDVFSPTIAEIEWAKRVSEVARKAEDSGVYDLLLEGKLIDPPVVLKADIIISRAKAVGLL